MVQIPPADVHCFPLGSAGFLLHLVERAKKCLDFSATLFIIHLLICIVYGGWPSSVTWWIVNGACVAAMALVGEWLCIRRELQEIPITRLRSSECFVLLPSVACCFNHVCSLQLAIPLGMNDS